LNWLHSYKLITLVSYLEVLPAAGKAWRAVPNWEQGQIVYDLKLQNSQGMITLPAGGTIVLPFHLVFHSNGESSCVWHDEAFALIALGQSLASAMGAFDIQNKDKSQRFYLEGVEVEIEFVDGERTVLCFDLVLSRALEKIPSIRSIDFLTISAAWDRIQETASKEYCKSEA
jgi:hypothetical protein